MASVGATSLNLAIESARPCAREGTRSGLSAPGWSFWEGQVEFGMEIDNNPAERAIRPIALGRKDYLFMGSAAGGKAAAIAYTLIETAKLNDIDPQAWLAEVLDRIPYYKINRVDELLPWNCAPIAAPTANT